MVTSAAFNAFLLFLSASAHGESGVDPNKQRTSKEDPPVIIQLQKETRALEDHAGEKNFYSTVMQVGSPKPQQFRMGFDLSGATTMLPSKDCKHTACHKREAYDKWTSDSAEDVQRDGKLVMPGEPKLPNRRKRFLARDVGTLDFVSVEFGEGKARGKFIRDKVCIDVKDGEPRCFPLAFLAASTMTDDPFLAEPYDGVIGLGVDGDVLSKDFYFLSQFTHSITGDMQAMFGLYIGAKQGAELALGGYDHKRVNSPIIWTPLLDTDDGRWQVSISSVRVGNKTIDMCSTGKCRAALDYSTSVFSVPFSLGASLENALSVASPKVCHDSVMPELQLVLNTVTLTVPIWDHALGNRDSSSPCTPALTKHTFAKNTPADDQLLILGESVLQRYYTVYDTDAKRVGFGLAASVEVAGPKKLKAEDDMTEASPLVQDDNKVIVLVQVTVTRSKTRSSLGV